MTSREWLAPQAAFEFVRRGYSPEQVNEYLDRLEYDLRILTADRNAANQRISELTAQLQASQSEADEFRNQLDRTALAPVSMANLSERMQRMVRLAEEEAAEIRARAHADNADAVAALQNDRAELAERQRAFEVERERVRTELAQHVDDLVARATAEADRIRADAAEHASAVVAQAQADANQTVANAQSHSNRVIAEAQMLAEQAAEERHRLDAESQRQRAEVEEDFSIAIAARRSSAYQAITQQEEESRARAERLVGDAQAEATRLVTEAHAEADRLVTDATGRSERILADATREAYRRVGEATAEAQRRVAWAAEDVHRRVVAAEHAVDTLFGMRQHVLGQLAGLQPWIDTIQEATHEASAALTEAPSEFGKPGGADFDPKVGTLFDDYVVADDGRPALRRTGGEAPSGTAESAEAKSAPMASAPRAVGHPAPDGESPAMRTSKRMSRAFFK
jgi:DivIVA domain-containing protein